MKKTATAITLLHLLVGAIIIFLTLSKYFSYDFFAVSLAIIVPSTVNFINISLSYYLKDDFNETVDQKSKYERIKVFINIFLVVYTLLTLTILIWQAVSPMTLIVFVAMFAGVETISGIILNRLLKFIYSS